MTLLFSTSQIHYVALLITQDEWYLPTSKPKLKSSLWNVMCLAPCLWFVFISQAAQFSLCSRIVKAAGISPIFFYVRFHCSNLHFEFDVEQNEESGSCELMLRISCSDCCFSLFVFQFFSQFALPRSQCWSNQQQCSTQQ